MLTYCLYFIPEGLKPVCKRFWWRIHSGTSIVLPAVLGALVLGSGLGLAKASALHKALSSFVVSVFPVLREIRR